MDIDVSYITENDKNKNDKLLNKMEPIITIVTPFYNGGKYLKETAKAVLNQTFPLYEWLIIDDGSTDKDSLKVLEEIEKLDDRITVYHKENTGLANTRDFGAEKSSKSTKYLCFLDDDDLIVNTYLECLYWTLETNKGASWAFTDVVHFGEYNALATTRYNPWDEIKQNVLVATALIRKDAFNKIGGYKLKEKAVNEDWNLWIRMIAADMYPVRASFFGFCYRRKIGKESELHRASKNKERTKAIISEAAKNITNPKNGIEYPKQDYNWDIIPEENKDVIIPQLESNKKTKILMIIPWMVIGGADKYNLDLIKGLDKDKFEVIILTTEPNFHVWRNDFERHAKAIYDLTSFIDRKNWLSFINYIIKKNNIDIIFNSNSTFGYSILPILKAKHPNLPILDYVHMEEWYNRNGGFSRDSSTVASVIDKTLVCNENTRKILIEHFGRKPEEVETVYIGVDEKKFNPETENKEAIKEKYKIPKDKKIISFIARIDLQKRPILLIEIMKKLKEKRNDFYLLVAGNGPMLKKVEGLSKKYKLEKNIKFFGAVSNTKEIYAVSDLTLNCSIKEGLALTSYESLSMGVPVVSANVGGQAELINDEVGKIVPCLQEEKDVYKLEYTDEEINNYVAQIEDVLDNLDKYKKNARQRILNGFTINHMIEKMSNILEKLASNPNEIKKNNGNSLSNCLDICKELNTKYFESFKNEYEWLVKDTNKKLDNEVNESCKKNSQNNSKNNENGIGNKIKDTIQNEGKRAFLNKIFVKLHIYHEMKLIVDVFERIYKFIKSIFTTIIGIIIDIFKLFKVIFIRIINIFLKLMRKNTIEIKD